MNDQNIILRWTEKDDSTEKCASWYIRGILPDGSFYGTVKVVAPDSYSFNIEGDLLNSESNEIRNLILKISEFDEDVRLHSGTSEGMVATGSLSNSITLLNYSIAQSGNHEVSNCFERIIEIMRPYVNEAGGST